MRRKSSKKRNKIIIIFLIVVGIFLFGGYYRLLTNYLQLIKLRKEITILHAENEIIRLRMVQYQKDKQLIERYARDELGMKKPKESIILIIDNGEK